MLRVILVCYSFNPNTSLFLLLLCCRFCTQNSTP